MSTKQKLVDSLNFDDVKNQLVVIDARVLMSMIGNMFQTIIEKDMEHTKSKQEQLKPNSDLLTMTEVLELLKVSKVTIHNWKKKGIIRSHKIGRKLFFKKDEILEAIKRQNYSCNYSN